MDVTEQFSPSFPKKLLNLKKQKLSLKKLIALELLVAKCKYGKDAMNLSETGNKNSKIQRHGILAVDFQKQSLVL